MSVAPASQRPVPGPPRPFTFPPFARASLDNGIEVVTCHLPGRALASINVIFDAGAEREAPDEGGVAALAARALTEGTEELDAGAFADAVERIGGDVAVGAGWDSMRARISVPVANLRDATALLAEAVRRPAFPASEVERLRDERLNRIKASYAHSTMRALLAFPASVFTEGTPYARPHEGTAETVAPLERGRVERFYRTFATPGSATIVFAGDLDGADPVAIARDLFGDWQAPEPERPAPAAGAREGVAVTLVHRPGSVQSDIVVGHEGIPRAHPDHPLADLALDVLAGLFNSRLNLLLREEKGYTYGVQGGLDARRRHGLVLTLAPVETKHTVESASDIVEGFRAMHGAGLTQAELDAARDYNLGVFPLRNETPEQIASLLSQLIVHRLPDDAFDREREVVTRATVDQVNEIAARHLRPQDLTVVVVGDADVVGDVLRAAGIGPVTVVEDPKTD